ncbi:Chemotaxis protein CheA [Planktothrix tepida]|uniref:Sensory transduction histidine kinase n=1 Tax=Planktothrix tepida PCC 9214 TaxID=671072 RepID=A0A1J1LH90_9CYAN|nr:Hpt domain-containing protein [Planktothrix tepida]CAD5935244.1 Chemotaxis protein CheA [Planktothrix tepida]CUR31843.1 Sensory transduction histidine kinase [Planktothrix tepida PCC 9214]
MPTNQDQKIFAIFMEEAEERLETLQTGLTELPAIMADADREGVTAIYRAAHSIKGAAAMLMDKMPSLTSINKVSKRLEDCFKMVKDTPLKIDATTQTLYTKGFEVLKNLIDRAASPAGLSEEMGEKILQASLPLYDKLENNLKGLMSGKASPATAPAAPATGTPGVANAVNQVMTVLKPMLQGFKQAESPESRKQLAGLCARLTKIGVGIEPWQTLVKTAHGAIANPKNSFKVLANPIINELKQGAELLQAGKANTIAPSAALSTLAGAKATAKPASGEITIPADPKEVVKVLLKTFNKQQLQAIAQLLIKHVKS